MFSEFESGRAGGDFGTQFRSPPQQSLDSYGQYDASNQQTSFGSYGGQGQQDQGYQGGLSSYGGYGSDLGGTSLRRAGDVSKLLSGESKTSRTSN